MKINKIRWAKLKTKWEILKMRAAYIDAERMIIEESNKGNDITGFEGKTIISFESMDPKGFHHEVDAFGNVKRIEERDFILQQAAEVRKKLDKALEDENYIKASALQRILDGLELKYRNLGGEFE